MPVHQLAVRHVVVAARQPDVAGEPVPDLEAGAEDPGAAELLALHPGQVESGPDVQAQDEAFRQVQVVRRRQPAVEGAVRVGRHAEERLDALPGDPGLVLDQHVDRVVLVVDRVELARAHPQHRTVRVGLRRVEEEAREDADERDAADVEDGPVLGPGG